MERFKQFEGNWICEHGQILKIRWVPFIQTIIAIYKPAKSRTRILMCSRDENILYIGLHALHWLEAMLVMTLATEIKTKKEIIIPMLECGSESDWSEENFGFPWVMPLGQFKREENQ
ncbi:MAG: hypothetical protein OEY89_16960 [Gammaproteobacteria bacterium]|nr:hypothetical protein [Gammaproteobacteria bacterium]